MECFVCIYWKSIFFFFFSSFLLKICCWCCRALSCLSPRLNLAFAVQGRSEIWLGNTEVYIGVSYLLKFSGSKKSKHWSAITMLKSWNMVVLTEATDCGYYGQISLCFCHLCQVKTLWKYLFLFSIDNVASNPSQTDEQLQAFF